MRKRLLIVALVGLAAVVVVFAWGARPQREIRPGEHVEIQVTGTLIGEPIRGSYRVDEDGKVTLGPAYGRVRIAGLDIDGATEAIRRALGKVLRSPEVAVARMGADALSRLEAENHRLLFENAILQTQVMNSRVGANQR